MSREELAAMVKLIMACDPWPVIDKDGKRDVENWTVIMDMVNQSAQMWGFVDWVDAYHKL